MRHEWKPWELWEDPDKDPEKLFSDCMIEHKGQFFGSMHHPNPIINAQLCDALLKSLEQIKD